MRNIGLPVLIGLAGGVLAGRLGIGMPVPVDSLVAVLLLAALAIWTAFLLHEAGHLIVGRLAGFRVAGLVAWPIEVAVEGGRLRFRLARGVVPLTAFVALYPGTLAGLRGRTIAMIAGGPAASALGAGLAFAGWLALPAADDARSFAVSTFLLVFAVVSLGTAVYSAWPRRVSGHPTDGLRLRRISGADAAAEQELAVIAVAGLSFSGTRPREWDPDLLRTATMRSEDPFLRYAARQVAIAAALDSGRVEEGRRLIGEALDDLESVPAAERPGLLVEAAYFLARHDGDPARARRLLEEAGHGILLHSHQRRIAEAAIAAAEGSTDHALVLLEQAKTTLPRASDRGEAAVAAERIADLERLALAGRPAATAPTGAT